jgi:hypothetical protein
MVKAGLALVLGPSNSNAIILQKIRNTGAFQGSGKGHMRECQQKIFLDLTNRVAWRAKDPQVQESGYVTPDS